MKGKPKTRETTIAKTGSAERMIIPIRGQAVILDAHLAEMYGVETKALKRAVKRNMERFPEDFMFQLTKEEAKNLRYQFGTSSWGGTRYLPYAFTEQGVAMLSGVLHSPRAVAVNIEIMRAFIKMRDVLAGHKELARKVGEHEHRLNDQDEVIISIVEEMRKQRTALPPAKPKRKIGFSKPD